MDKRLPTLDLIAKFARLLMKPIISDELEGLVSVDLGVGVDLDKIDPVTIGPLEVADTITTRRRNGRMRAIREDELIRGRTTPRTSPPAPPLILSFRCRRRAGCCQNFP
jgi:hypothetical protein